MRSFVFGLLLLGSTGFASDVFNIGIKVNLEYSDFNHHCKLSALVDPYRLSAEFKEGKAERAMLSHKPRFLPPKTVELTRYELEQLDIREESNLFWIKQMGVSSDLLKHLIFSGEGFGSDSCIPPKDVAFAITEDVVFDFGVESVGYLLPHLIHSQEVVLRGLKSDSTPFRIKVSLTQDRR